MAHPVKHPAVAVGNKEILTEINLISQIQQIETRLAVQPKSLRFAQLADAYISMGQYDDGIQICEEGVKSFPNYTTASLVLARGYYLSGNKAKASDVLENFLHVRPSHIVARKMLGDIALENDDIKTAVAHYRIALRLDPINRQIIQTLVDLKDQYQKLKGSTLEEEEEDVIRPREKAPAAQTVAPTPVGKRESITQEFRMPSSKKSLTEEMEQVEDSIVESFMSDKPKDVTVETVQPKPAGIETIRPEESKAAEIGVVEPAVEPAPAKEGAAVLDTSSLTPAFADAKGVLYFYADEDLSFAQFKIRNELQRLGKAVVMDRAELDHLIGGKPAPKAIEESLIDFEVVPKVPQKKPVVDFDETFEIADIRRTKTEPATPKQPAVQEEISEEQEPLTKEEQEMILSEVDLGYRDYLDVITDEEDLLEAVFQDDLPAGEEEDEAAEIVGMKTVSAEPDDAGDTLLAYDDYLDELKDDDLIAEASLEEEPALSLDDYSTYLDDSDDLIDFATYALVSGSNGELLQSLDGGEQLLSYRDYMGQSLPVDVRAEAQLDQAAATTPAAITEAVAETEVAVEESRVEPVKSKAPESFRTEPAPAMIEEEEEVEYVEEEEEIDPGEVSMELVEQFAARGQFGAAYKVCRMLKLNNPTDAKIDRKILELKRLYVWSTQMVG